MSLAARAARTSERCPSWRAPIVGTNPSRFPTYRGARDAVRISAIVVQIFKGVPLCRRNPGYGDVRAFQKTTDNSFVFSEGNFLLLGSAGACFSCGDHSAVRPLRSRKLRQGGQQFIRLKDDFGAILHI